MNEGIGEIPIDPEHLEWAREPFIHINLLRQDALQKGIDPSRAILGEVLHLIAGDDFNCFGASNAPFVPGNAAIGKEQLMIRLIGEIDTPELPEEIRNRLQEVKERLEKMNWQTKNGFGKARKLWIRRVRNFVRAQIIEDPKCHEAMEDFYKREVEASSIPPTE